MKGNDREPGIDALNQRPSAPATLPAARHIIEAFFRTVEPHVRGRLYLILLPNMPVEVRGELARQAGGHDALIIDTTDALAAQVAATGLSNHVSPRDAHMNRLALQVIAGEIGRNLH
jgi:hypothetical protein